MVSLACSFHNPTSSFKPTVSCDHVIAHVIQKSLDILFDEISSSNYLQIAIVFGLQTL